jgi:hypothetical protein
MVVKKIYMHSVRTSMLKKKMSKDTDIALLKQQIEVIRNNELVHLKEDINRVDKKVDNIAAENKEAHEKFETKIDGLTIKIVKIIAIASCIWAIIGIVLVPIIVGYMTRTK